jgi:hypothetical protein
MSKAKQIAQDILNAAKADGWNVMVERGLLVITKPIKVGSNEDFAKADSEYYNIIGRLPQTRPGSTWGTDGGGVGALSAMKHGLFEMKRSGGSKLVLKQLEKLINAV